MLKHVVLLRVRDATPEKQVEEAFRDLAALVGKIPGLKEFSGGANNSPENKAHGFTHGFVMGFENAATRDAYLPHPDHQRAAAKLRAFAEDVLVLDYGGPAE